MPPEPDRTGAEARPLIAFDTSGPWIRAALLRADGHCLLHQETLETGQAERLVPALEALLAQGGIGWGDLGAIAVGTGPGNFTGIRIAVAAARGLALGLGIPAIGVTMFQARALGLPRPLRVVEEARRGEAWVQDFPDDGPPLPACLMPLALAGPVTAPALPLAEAIARIAIRQAHLPQPRPAPFYLRPADALPPADPPPALLDA